MLLGDTGGGAAPPRPLLATATTAAVWTGRPLPRPSRTTGGVLSLPQSERRGLGKSRMGRSRLSLIGSNPLRLHLVRLTKADHESPDTRGEPPLHTPIQPMIDERVGSSRVAGKWWLPSLHSTPRKESGHCVPLSIKYLTPFGGPWKWGRRMERECQFPTNSQTRLMYRCGRVKFVTLLVGEDSCRRIQWCLLFANFASNLGSAEEVQREMGPEEACQTGLGTGS